MPGERGCTLSFMASDIVYNQTRVLWKGRAKDSLLKVFHPPWKLPSRTNSWRKRTTPGSIKATTEEIRNGAGSGNLLQSGTTQSGLKSRSFPDLVVYLLSVWTSRQINESTPPFSYESRMSCVLCFFPIKVSPPKRCLTLYTHFLVWEVED